MESQLKITIILATFNRADLVGHTIDSILSQTYENWELIIIDDFSTDGTAQLLQEFSGKDHRIFYHFKKGEHKKGPSGSRNYGIEIALKRKAGLIHFFDDDDLMDPHKLELQLTPFLHDPELKITACQYKRFKEGEDKRSLLPEKLESEDLAVDFLFNRIRINTGCLLMKTELLKEERFDEDLSYGEEREFFLRILFRYRPRTVFINKILFGYRFHEISLTQNPDLKKRRLGALAGINKSLWDYLHKHQIISPETVAFFLRQFLLENHDKEYLAKIYRFTLEKNKLNFLENFKFRLIIKAHQVYIRVLYKLLLMKI